MNPCSRDADIAVIKTEVNQLQQGFSELKEVYNLIYGLTTNVSLLTDQMVRMNDDIVTVKSDVVDIKTAPVKEYTTLKIGFMSTIISIIIKLIFDNIL